MRTVSILGKGRQCAILILVCSFVTFTAPAIAGGPTGAVSGQDILVIVKGVATPFSVFGLIHRFDQIPGVEQVSFDLSQGLADLRLKPGAQVTDEEIRRAVRSASYTPGEISRPPRPVPNDRASLAIGGPAPQP